jgi:hypothetical protein
VTSPHDRHYRFEFDYFGKSVLGISEVSTELQSPRVPDENPWLLCALALSRAKQGDFTLMPALVELHSDSGDTAVDHMCSALLAIAGTTESFSLIVERVTRTRSFRPVFGFCGDLAVRGELSYIPTLLEKYLANQDDPDAAVLTDYLWDLIGDQLFPIGDDYEDRVMWCYQKMLHEFGHERVLVLRGEPYGVRPLARHIFREVQAPSFRVIRKVAFEAATGLDCSRWYRDRQVQPLTVAATIEEFLDSPLSQKFEDGVRYFLGHRIP